MKTIQLITKKNCSRCDLLKDWLKNRNISYEELTIENEEVRNQLLEDKKFTQMFCDDMGCVIITPVLKIKETGKFYAKRLFGMSGIREEFTQKLLEID
jgi:arsenate reductase-like glutaredoxin family protein